VTKFLVFDLAAGSIADLVNGSNLLGDGNKIQVGVGSLGLLLSAFSGALAGDFMFTFQNSSCETHELNSLLSMFNL